MELDTVTGHNVFGKELFKVNPPSTTKPDTMRRRLARDDALDAVRLRGVSKAAVDETSISFKYPVTNPPKEQLDNGVGAVQFSVMDGTNLLYTYVKNPYGSGAKPFSCLALLFVFIYSLCL
eukprot:Platyproteum_vivax@DN6505_c0_g1_i1.p1